MNGSDFAKAKQFADTAFSGTVQRLRQKLDDDVAQLAASSAARGVFMSGGRIIQEARLRGEFIWSCIHARADAFIEGCHLHNVVIDDGVTDAIINDVSTMRMQMVAGSKAALVQSGRMGAIPSASHEIERASSLAIPEIRANIERAKLAKQSRPESKSQVTNVYHVYGHNPHWNVNTTDNSVNAITISHEEVFVKLREELSQNVANDDQRTMILAKLGELEKATNTKAFAERFTEFIAVSANLMTIIGPFVPALTEILTKSLR